MKYSLSILFVSFLLSCNHTVIQKDGLTLMETSGSITLDIDSETKFLTKALFYLINEAGEEMISFEGDNKILFYRLKDGTLMHTVYLQKEGANGVGTVFGHYPYSMDSIYITRRNVPELYLVDRNGTVLDKYIYPEDQHGEMCTNAISSSVVYAPLVKIGEKLFLNQFLLDGGNTKGEMLEKNPLSVIIDANTKQVEKSLVTYPRLWETIDEFSFAEYSRLFDGERFVYSFFWDENIYLVDPNHTETLKVPVKSRYINKLEKGKKRASDFQAGLRNSIETTRYGNIIYDPYREV